MVLVKRLDINTVFYINRLLIILCEYLRTNLVFFREIYRVLLLPVGLVSKCHYFSLDRKILLEDLGLIFLMLFIR